MTGEQILNKGPLLQKQQGQTQCILPKETSDDDAVHYTASPWNWVICTKRHKTA